MFHLHWLPIKSRIEYKLLTLTHKCVYGEAPKDPTDLITKRGVRQNGLRSAEMVNRLEVPSLSAKHLMQDPSKVQYPTYGTIYQMKSEAYRYMKPLRNQ